MYQFKYADMEFSKDGGLDELIALDRYAVPTYGGYQIGDTVVAIYDEKMQSKRVGTVLDFIGEDKIKFQDRLGEEHEIRTELIHKPLELTPAELWTRWSKGGASVEKTMVQREYWEDKFRKLVDGYGYSLGGRIQLMLGQEFLTGKKANLTSYNCFVARCPRPHENSIDQFIDGVDLAYKEGSIMRRGGGVGINISTFNTCKGSGAKKEDFVFYLDKSHKDYKELIKRKLLSKFNNVKVVTDKEEFYKEMKLAGESGHFIKAVDSVDNGLFDNMKEMSRASYEGKVVFIDFNALRYRNSIVKGVNGRSSGATSWMELFVLIAGLLQQDEIDNVDFAETFSSVTHLIIQGGSRRGALMLICNVDNKNVRKFIARKREMGFLSGANISIGIDDKFMAWVKLAKSMTDAELVDKPELKEALSLWNLLIKCAWESAEPGIVWLERYNKESNSWYFSPLVCTNPCGEQGLPEWGVCNLGHLVLSRYYSTSPVYNRVSNKKDELYYPQWQDLKKYNVDWDELAEACHTAVRLQDNIIDYTDYFLEENREVQLKERRVGIGSMSLGTLMIRLKLRYGSKEGIEFTDILYKFIAYHIYSASMDIAEEKGSFPAYEYEKFIQSGFMKRFLKEFPDLAEKLKRTGIRNVTLLTQAPTGSTATYIDNIPLFVALFFGASTGVEPYFAFEYWRTGRLGSYQQFCQIAKVYMDENGIESADDLPEWFVTAMELTPEEHVRMQAACQKWTDSSISKTANAPEDYTIKQVDELYMLGYDLGLKGITIYRDKSRDAQVLATKKEDAKLEMHIEAEKLEQLEREQELDNNTSDMYNKQELDDDDDDYADESYYDVLEVLPEIKKRPEDLFGITRKMRTQFGDKIVKSYVVVNVDSDGQPVEVFVTSNNPEFDQLASVIGRITTQFLRIATTKDNVGQIVKHLRKGQTLGTFSSKLASLIEGIAVGKIKLPTFTEGLLDVIATEGKKKSKPKMVFQECESCGEQAYDRANCICTKCGASHCN